LIQAGRASERMSTEDGVKQYLGMVTDLQDDVPLSQRPRTHHKPPRDNVFVGLKMFGQGGEATNIIPCNSPLTFEVDLENVNDPGDLTCAIALFNEKNQRVAVFHTLYNSGVTFRAPAGGKKKMVCHVPALPLSPGTYYVELVYADGFNMLERVERADRLDIIYADVLGHGKLPSQRQAAVVLPC